MPGLCALCVNVRIVESGKGSRFYLCKLAADDSRFAKYPRLPVLFCEGFVKEERPHSEVGSESGESP